jgi:hypothetical protein
MTEYRGELGILGTPEDWEHAKRDNDERLAEERRQAAQAAEDAAKLQYDLDRIDAMALHFLKDGLAASKETARITPRQRKDYAAYRAYCSRHGWPPDAPQTLFAFLASDLSRPARVRRLHNSIQAVVQSTGLENITNDPIICALMRLLARKKKSTQPQNKEH